MKVKNIVFIILTCTSFNVHSSSAPACVAAGSGAQAEQASENLSIPITLPVPSLENHTDVAAISRAQGKPFLLDKEVIGYMYYSGCVYRVPKLTPEDMFISNPPTVEKARVLETRMLERAKEAQTDVNRWHYVMIANFMGMVREGLTKNAVLKANQQLKQENEELKKQLAALKIAHESMPQVSGGPQQNVQPPAAK